MKVPAVRVHQLPVVDEPRGKLSYAESGRELPFAPARYFVVYDVPRGQVRGGHAHRRVDQFLVCVRGSVTITVDDGRRTDEVLLDSPATAVHIPPKIWSTQRDHSADAVLLVFSSDPYDPAEYIRDYDEFLSLVGEG